MTDTRITRRAAMMAAGAITAWAASPARALLRSADAGSTAEIDALVSRMTIEEKAGQLTIMAAAWAGSAATALNPPSAGATFEQQLADTRAGRLTGVFNGHGADMSRRMQTVAMKESRLKVPLIFAADIIHGFRTVFPVPLGEAASWDPELAERTARIAAVEASAAGIDWTFAPMVDIARDQRWGRGVEGAGEDVWLGKMFAAARVKGFQGEKLTASDAVMACMKHFVAYGAAEAGLDYSTVDVSERTLRDIYLPPFKTGLDAGALSVMAAFNELSGVPATADDWLMRDLLRDEWKFDGIVVSDYTGDEELIAHGVAKDGRDAARLAFLAGVDMSMQSNLYMQHLPSLVASGEVPVARVDESVRRVLAVKAKLGLFDDPFRRIDPRREKTRVLTPANRKVAREVAVKSAVLLKNEGNLLPLPKAGKRIALIGPFAEGQHDLVGPWCVYGDDAQAVDLATGLRAKGATITVTPGSAPEEPIAGGIAAAVAAAQAADVVVLAVGEHTGMSGEAQSRASIALPAPQLALAEAVAATGKPIVVVLKNGRAMELTGAIAAAPAILVTWFLGTETGNAIGDLLFGDASPSGRLPVSFPHATGQEPYHYAHKPTGRPNPAGAPQPYKAHFRGLLNEALYPFGHGLTYGQVGYSALNLGGGKLAMNGQLVVQATITNTGTRAAEEVVQLYIRDRVASITRPVRQLVNFRRILLAPGASQAVRFTLTAKDLAFVGRDLRMVTEPGSFDLWIAPSAQAEGAHGSFELA